MGRLPVNDSTLASDASSTYGMAGVLTFAHGSKHSSGLAGLFWQISWGEWSTMVPTPGLRPGAAEINVAEFLAALITLETFTEFCKGSITTLEIDNTTAKTWIDTARCTKAPLDRCAQGIHLHILNKNMKVKTSWIPSARNVVADICSRQHFPWHAAGHIHPIAGCRYRRVSPKFVNLLRLL